MLQLHKAAVIVIPAQKEPSGMANAHQGQRQGQARTCIGLARGAAEEFWRNFSFDFANLCLKCCKKEVMFKKKKKKEICEKKITELLRSLSRHWMVKMVVFNSLIPTNPICSKLISRLPEWSLQDKLNLITFRHKFPMTFAPKTDTKQDALWSLKITKKNWGLLLTVTERNVRTKKRKLELVMKHVSSA